MKLNYVEVVALLDYFGTMTYTELKAKKLLSIVNRMNDNFSIIEPEEWHRDVFDLLYTGNKIKAIKMIKEETLCGLKEAKDIADAVCHEMSINNLHWQVTYPCIYEFVSLNKSSADLVELLLRVAQKNEI
jgi:hypothetical protein